MRLLSMCEALGSISDTAKEKKKRKGKLTENLTLRVAASGTGEMARLLKARLTAKREQLGQEVWVKSAAELAGFQRGP